MPRLRHVRTGVEVSVSDTTAARLIGYEPVEEKKAAPRKKAAAKSDDNK